MATTGSDLVQEADGSFSKQVRLIVESSISVGHNTTGLGDNRKTVASAGTAEALAGSTAIKWVIVTAETDNTGIVVVGGSTVVAALATRRGVPLAAGDSVTLTIDNLADVFVDATVSTDGVTFVYGT